MRSKLYPGMSIYVLHMYNAMFVEHVSDTASAVSCVAGTVMCNAVFVEHVSDTASVVPCVAGTVMCNAMFV